MLKTSAPGLSALFISASLQTYALVPGARAVDRLTDIRTNLRLPVL